MGEAPASGTRELSRNGLTKLLFDRASNQPKISVFFNHKLVDIDFKTKQLVISCPMGEIKFLDSSEARVFGADGAYSKVRQLIQQSVKDDWGVCNVIPWSYQFRVLYSRLKAKSSPLLNVKSHYIFTGCFTSYLNGRWTCTIGLRNSDPLADLKILQSATASTGNIIALRNILKKRAPRLEPVIENEELEAFFSRKLFSGVVVDCRFANYNEWILLIGDAHHSVLPPTGQGINSGLQDVQILVKAFKSNPEDAFSYYQSTRGVDLQSLIYYAKYLNEDPHFLGERWARVLFRVLESNLARKPIANRLFSEEITCYSDIVGEWRKYQYFLLPLCRLLAYPLGFVLSLSLLRPK